MFKNRFVAVLALALGSYLIISLAHGTYDLWQRAERVKEVQRKRQEEEKRKAELKEKLGYSQSPEFIERQVREKLNLVKPGETIVIIPPFEATQSTTFEALPNWRRWLKLFF